MVETDREYTVLQWSGHAASVTERFSGLLARQALVDVTLLCQNQELRVHKLVLASSSLYFEEILEQDLGQEPTIILNNLHFNILKAMIEFMYCGETKIAYCQLQSLLDAARVFKVKHLESLVNSMIDLKNPPENEEDNSLDSINNSTQSDSNDLEHSCPSTNKLFEDSTREEAPEAPPNEEETLNHLPQVQQSLKPINPEINSNEMDKFDSPGSIGQCSRVYTPRKRKILDNKTQFTPLKPPQPLPTDCIDLSSDKNCDISSFSSSSWSTINLETEYIFSVHSETIHINPQKCSTDKQPSIYDDLNIHEFAVSSYKNLQTKIKELYCDKNKNSSTPVLRRSVRLNQNDDTFIDNDNQDDEKNRLKKFSRIKSRISDENRKNARSLRSKRKKIITKTECINNNNNDDDDIPVKLNTTASVDRSLWGDMSDLLDDCHNTTSPPANNIPFAVGLLPLRAALERMQAIPDYQPRKTRSSSVAPYNYGAKRNGGNLESIVSKKKIDGDDTVCHIEIHTSSQSTGNKIIQAKRFMQIEANNKP